MSDTNMDDANGLSSTFSGLNVNAKPFVPNPNAAAFVPSFMKSTVSPQGGFPSSGGTGEPPPPQPPDEPVDSWEDSAQDDISEVKEPTPASAEQVDEEQVEGQRANGETGEEEIEDEDEEEELPPAMRSRIKSGDGESPASRKEHVNVVFVGHVDAGKSTIGGQIMYLTGMVDKRTLEKYEREAKEKNRESWYLSWALDTNLEEREKGKTVEVGRAFFETDKKHFTILDAPGHRSFVPNMIGGASQADLAVLVISARKGEFETGFDRGGQTREHAMLAKTAGVKHLVVLVNKMDDPTVQWSEERFNECKDKLTPYLRKCGFNPKTDFVFMPCSGLTGEFLKERSGNVATWYT
ncbi:unnamed protein product [Cyprideis torosa]|uniref:Uncharacterized protein n=1 Tax=Cyprideis torosa TaxID=163714 RepID=A0A7R8ZNI2_9CRUS|nr:unnamed protein product [Cyprideis torosa]CAG0891630.1 unnamed protein product [Cyprideis torosa]